MVPSPKTIDDNVREARRNGGATWLPNSTITLPPEPKPQDATPRHRRGNIRLCDTPNCEMDAVQNNLCHEHWRKTLTPKQGRKP